MSSRKKFIMASTAALLGILALLFGGAGMTAFASQTSLPNDGLAGKLSTLFSRYPLVLDKVFTNVPQEAKPAIEHAIQAAQKSGQSNPTNTQPQEFTGVVESIGSQTWKISGQNVAITAQTELKSNIAVGDQVQVHVVAGEAGALTALEIEKVAPDVQPYPAPDQPGQIDEDQDHQAADDQVGESPEDDHSGEEAGEDQDDAEELEKSSDETSSSHDAGAVPTITTNTGSDDDQDSHDQAGENEQDDHHDDGSDHNASGNSQGGSNDQGGDHESGDD